MISRLDPYQHRICPDCGHDLRPIVYGMPNGGLLAAAERGELVLGGCVIGPAELACSRCGWQDEPAEESFTDLVDAGDLYDGLPTDTHDLAGLTIREAERLEADAESMTALVMLADGLLDTLRRAQPAEHWLSRAEHVAATVRAAPERAIEAAIIARRTIGRVLDLCDDSERTHEDDWLYEKVLTARLHVPIATSLLDDALADAMPAVRHLARLSLAVALEADSDAGQDLERTARGALRVDLPGLTAPSLVAEQPELWSVTFDELRFELTGLLANMLVDHRTYLILANAECENRFVQSLTFDRGLHVESVGDHFLSGDEKLTDTEKARLEALGWSHPDGEPPNWHRSWDESVNVHAVADLLVDTLVDVHGLDDPGALDLTIAQTVDPFGH
jgi:hypothetical protein